MLRPTVGSGLVISWAGMRGIVTLAAALALPAAFPYRDLIVLTAFAVVVGTLVIQGLTLKPLLRALDLQDDDPVGREVALARERALRRRAGELRGRSLAARGSGPPGVRRAPRARRAACGRGRREPVSTCRGARRRASAPRGRRCSRCAISDEIGDDAFHQIEEELDWLEMAGGGKDAKSTES